MKKYNLSKIMKRAWELVKKAGMTISSGLRKAWEEAKNMEETLTEKLIKNLETMLHGNIYINLGMDRKVNAKTTEKDGVKTTKLYITCYTLAGRYKGSYKCGYVVNNQEYFVGRYDDVNALTCEYIGR